MKPLEIMTPVISERQQKMIDEVQQFIDAGCEAAELWKDDNVTTSRNVDLYERTLRLMQVPVRTYDICQRRGKVIIKKHGVRLYNYQPKEDNT